MAFWIFSMEVGLIKIAEFSDISESEELLLVMTGTPI
jgi:hypothetical protein